MTDRDAIIDHLEQQIPELAVAALTQAYHASLAAGNHVWIVEDDAIYEVSPEGKRTFIKSVEPSVPVEPGTTYFLR